MIVIFLCVANSARSQMAEGLARASAPSGVTVYSAGSRPASVNPNAVAVMREVGIDLTHHHAKGLDDVPLADADLIVTLCSEEECPITPPHVERRSWALPDPAAVTASPEATLAAFRATRDAIAARIRGLWSPRIA